jgi:hypothetical protein
MARNLLLGLALGSRLSSQLPRRPVCRQAYGAYPARVNLSRFCIRDQSPLFCCKGRAGLVVNTTAIVPQRLPPMHMFQEIRVCPGRRRTRQTRPLLRQRAFPSGSLDAHSLYPFPCRGICIHASECCCRARGFRKVVFWIFYQKVISLNMQERIARAKVAEGL